MGRPRKNPASVMNVDLRIPMTPDQKELIQEAARANPEGMAAWAREVLLREASKQRTGSTPTRKGARGGSAG